jgi:hypothetical protein
MPTSVRTKVQKKQLAFAPAHEDVQQTKRLEQAVLDLEDAVFQVLNADKGHNFHDVDFLYWNRRLKSIATQISLALSEYRGPRRFHYHYRHDPKDFDTLYPVAGPAPLDTICRVCREGITSCAEMVGIQDEQGLHTRNKLEQALRLFLIRCQGPARKN